MKRCECVPATWKGRHGYCIRNGHVEATVLSGGGAIVDFRLRESQVNLLWEAPWKTIDPHTFQHVRDEPLYGPRPVGPMLAGCTGHVVAAGYFGMPPEDRLDLPLHGEACCSLWRVDEVSESDQAIDLVMSVDMPATGLQLERRIQLREDASALAIQERLRNTTGNDVAYQWVQHVMFGSPFFAGPLASLWLPASRCITWPLGYEGHAALEDNIEFDWPLAPGVDHNLVNLAHPFARPRSGFVASILLHNSANAFAAITNAHLGLLAGYAFSRETYPWVTLWEENRARTQSPWLGTTQVRGVEFGNSPMPLGLEQAQKQGALFGTPTYRTLGPFCCTSTEYSLFAASITTDQTEVTGITRAAGKLGIHFAAAESMHLLDSTG